MLKSLLNFISETKTWQDAVAARDHAHLPSVLFDLFSNYGQDFVKTYTVDAIAFRVNNSGVVCDDGEHIVLTITLATEGKLEVESLIC